MRTFFTFRLTRNFKTCCYAFAVLLLLNCQQALAAAPVITSVTPVRGVPLVTTVVINGSGFNDTTTNNAVYFGATKATVSVASATSLTVLVPLGSLYSNISVANLTTRLSCLQRDFFTPTFDSSCYIPATRGFKPMVNIATGATVNADADAYHVAIGDMDGDGKNDLVVGCYDFLIPGSPNSASPVFVYRNIGANGVVAYAAPIVCTASHGVRNIKLADLDRDGKLDIVASASGSGRVSIFRNLSTSGTISISAGFNLALTSGAFETVVADFDGDGKPDIAAVCYAIDSIELFRNTISAPLVGPFINPANPNGSFKNYIVGLQGGGLNPLSIAAADFDGDGKTDLATSNIATGDVSVYRNISIVDSFMFVAPVQFSAGTNTAQVIAVDVNNDSKPDIIVGNGTASSFTIFENTATSGVINSSSFSAAVSVATPSGITVGLAPGDLNGDGKVDLAISDNSNNTVRTFYNTSTGGTITSATFVFGESWATGASTNPLGIAIGDVDGDTKPDIAFVNEHANKISILESVAVPDTNSIVGVDSICAAIPTTLTSLLCTGAKGFWSVTNNHASISDTTGVLTGLTAGLDTVVCAVVYLSDTNFIRHTVYIKAVADTGIITGADSFCVGASITLSDTTSGGVWSSSNGAIATVDAASGMVTGISAGIAIISYTTQSVACGPLSASHAVTVNALPNAGTITGANGMCIGASTTLTASVPGGTWINLFPVIASSVPAGTTNTLIGLTVGADTVLYVATSLFCGSDTAVKAVGVLSTGVSLPISGVDSMCSGTTTTFTNGAVGGTWSSANPSIASINTATGEITGLATGTTTISYTVNFGCGPVDTFKNITVNPSPVAGTIVGVDSVCSGSIITLTNPTGTTGGVWSSSNNVIATVTSSGVVTGVSTTLATATITYTVSTFSCGTVSATQNVTVKASPVAGTITGLDSVCSAASITLANATGTTGGTWSSISPAIATVSPTGVVTGVSASLATTTISYTVSTFSCGTVAATHAVTVKPIPNAGTITGLDSVCSGAIITLANATGALGGIWSSSSTAIATVSPTGVVTGVTNSLATTSIVYTSSTFSCGTATTNFAVTVKPIPVAGLIVGLDSVCSGAAITLTNPTGTPGGIWSSLSTAIATVSPTGVVTGVSTGLATTTITYTISTFSCGSAAPVHAVTVKPIPNAGAITGLDSVCSGASITLANATGAPGGIWSSFSTAIATVSPTGVVTGVTNSLATTSIVYTSSTFSCGTVTTNFAVTVKPIPVAGLIVGLDSVCSGAVITLTNPTGTPGGVWSSLSTAIATISPTGVVTGVSAGLATTTITYTISTFSCGSATPVHAVTVKPLPNAGTITGLDSVCSGASITLANATANPGTWSSLSTAIATVSPTGVVTGATNSLATTSIVYTSSTFSCGTATTNFAVTVKPTPVAGLIVGLDSVCSGATITLTNPTGTPGGVWSSLSTAVATVSPTGLVTGVSAGLTTTTITYTISTFSCGSATPVHAVTVKPLPNAGTITGLDSVCSGASITLANATANPGTWSSLSTAIATVSPSGVVTGVTNSLATTSIVYTSSTFSCGTATTNFAVTVKPIPVAGLIVGLDSVCSGAAITLTNPTGTPGGVWSSLSTAIATVSPTGVVTGVSAGLATTTITYTISTFSCGSAAPFHAVTVKALPNAGTITGLDSVCSGATITLANPTANPVGTWSSLSTATATVSPTGVVTGVTNSLATTSIVYTSSTFSCGTATTNFAVTVKPLPFAGVILGLDSVCTGGTITLTNPTGTINGTWTSASTAIATVGLFNGIVTGVSTTLATTTITYSANTFSCGSSTTLHAVTVKALPNAGTISGPNNVCYGASISLSSSVPGGTWASGNTAIATMASNFVTGASITLASTNISYTVTSFSCGSAVANHAVTVNPYPNAGTITGSSTVCEASTTSLTNVVTGGVWSSSPLTIATVSPTGAVHGVAPGNATITYTTTNTCGSTDAYFSMTVNPLPNAGTITGIDSVCQAAVTILSDLAIGGTWSSSLTSIATVSGGTVGGVSPGTSTIAYTVTNGCGTAIASVIVTVNPLPNAGTITGTAIVCEAAVTSLTSSVPGGVWTSGSTANANVSSTGVVGGVLAGTATISYAVSNSCGTAYATKVVTVNPLPVAGTITGGTNVCPGTTLALADLSPGGVWISGNTSLATVTSGGVVGGVSAGNVTISYSVTNSCGTAIATYAVTVIPLPLAGTITGPSLACPGASVSLSETVSGGVWTSSNLPVATVTSTTGVVWGVSPGTFNIRYTYTNFCGSAFTIHPMTVNPIVVPSVSITLSPSDTLCAGDTITYSAIAINGGPTPTFAWTNYGGAIGTGNPFNYTPANGDHISCILISSAPCPVPPTANADTTFSMYVYPVVTPTITIISSVPGDTLSFLGESITFNATSTYGGPGGTFQWFVNGVAIPGATSTSFAYLFESSDTVYCVLTSTLPCTTDSTDTSNHVIIIGDYLGIGNAGTTIGTVRIFPNPNTGNFILKGSVNSVSNDPVKYDVLDMMGKVVYSNSIIPRNGIIEENIHLDKEVTSGQYVLRIVKDNESKYLRFIILNQQ